MRLTHLTLKNWRNFKSADFSVGDRLFVVGANASGKSNLLDALRFLKEVASVGGGFQDAIASRGGMKRIRCLAARNFNRGRVTLEVAIGSDRSPSAWIYSITFGQEPRGQHRPVLVREAVRNNGSTVIERPTPADRDDPERMTQTHLEQVNANRDFREITEFLASVQYLHPVPHLIREPGRFGDREGNPFGGDLLIRMARTPQRKRNHRLQLIGQALQIAVPQLGDLKLVQDDAGSWHLEARYQHWRSQGASQDERLFSDGTLRLIGLLWALLDGTTGAGPVLLEEPELSLHAAVVKQLPAIFNRVRMSGGPQVLVSTHSNDILSDAGLGMDEVVCLQPGKEGTEAALASALPEVQSLLDSGMSLAEILAPRTEPPRVGEFLDQVGPA